VKRVVQGPFGAAVAASPFFTSSRPLMSQSRLDFCSPFPAAANVSVTTAGQHPLASSACDQFVTSPMQNNSLRKRNAPDADAFASVSPIQSSADTALTSPASARPFPDFAFSPLNSNRQTVDALPKVMALPFQGFGSPLPKPFGFTASPEPQRQQSTAPILTPEKLSQSFDSVAGPTSPPNPVTSAKFDAEIVCRPLLLEPQADDAVALQGDAVSADAHNSSISTRVGAESIISSKEHPDLSLPFTNAFSTFSQQHVERSSDSQPAENACSPKPRFQSPTRVRSVLASPFSPVAEDQAPVELGSPVALLSPSFHNHTVVESTTCLSAIKLSRYNTKTTLYYLLLLLLTINVSRVLFRIHRYS
jgi:hypothetical protein